MNQRVFKIGDIVKIDLDSPINTPSEFGKYTNHYRVIEVDYSRKDVENDYIKVNLTGDNKYTWYLAHRFELAKNTIVKEILDDL